jgi:hypothetical protein
MRLLGFTDLGHYGLLNLYFICSFLAVLGVESRVGNCSSTWAVPPALNLYFLKAICYEALEIHLMGKKGHEHGN